MAQMKTTFFLLVLLWVCSSNHATTIVPFSNLAEMARASDRVVLVRAIEFKENTENGVTRFYTHFELIDNLSGSRSHPVIVQHDRIKTPRYERILFGDIEYKLGNTYLLFLAENPNNTYQPILSSFGVYTQTVHQGNNLLTPIEYEANIVSSTPYEPLYTYRTNALIPLLKGALNGKRSWNGKSIKYEHPEAFLTASIRTAPSHCTFLDSDTIPHWSNFPSLPLPVWSHENGDPGCTHLLPTAMANMNNNYGGIQLDSAGTHNYSPSCTSGTAIGNEYIDWIDNTYGESRHMLLQYNDPCGEIPNLSGCSGILARGGLLITSTVHTEHGKLWRDAAYGTVLINNSVCACLTDSKYINLLTHEMTHALGFGHISTGSGFANMNTGRQGPITSLDIQCVNYSYPPTSNDCNTLETLDGLNIYTPMTLRASSEINILNLNLKNLAELTLIAPSIVIDPSVDVPAATTLITIQENQCN